MAGGIWVEVVQSTSAVQAACPICATAFDLKLPAVVLHLDQRPLGYLCESCLALGPRGAATGVRERAAALRTSLREATKRLRGGAWTAMVEALRERAEFWAALAERLEQLDRWPYHNGPSPAPPTA